MAVKPITNPNPPFNSKINRADQVSIRDFKSGVGNSRKSLPAKDWSKNYAITLKDIDTTMMGHIKNVMKLKVRENGEMINVPVFWGNEERWKNVRDRGYMRDRNGTIMLPLIVVRRTNVVFTDSMPQSFDHDVKGNHIQVVRGQKYSKNNRYDRFSVQQGRQPEIERVVTGMPDFIDCTYEFIVMTSYQEQMNLITETFVEHENTYFGDEHSYRFLSSLEGSFSDASEFEVSSERMIKSTFGIMLKAYVLPEVATSIGTGTTFEMGRKIAPTKVSFTYEGDATDKQISGD